MACLDHEIADFYLNQCGLTAFEKRALCHAFNLKPPGSLPPLDSKTKLGTIKAARTRYLAKIAAAEAKRSGAT